MYAYMCICVHASMCVCVRACARVCVRVFLGGGGLSIKKKKRKKRRKGSKESKERSYSSPMPMSHRLGIARAGVGVA